MHAKNTNINVVCHGNNSFRRMDMGTCEEISFHRKWINANEVFFITCAPRLLFIACSGFLRHRMTKILHLLKSINDNEKGRKYVLFHLKDKSLRTIVLIDLNTNVTTEFTWAKVLESAGLMEGQGPHSHQWDDVWWHMYDVYMMRALSPFPHSWASLNFLEWSKAQDGKSK